MANSTEAALPLLGHHVLAAARKTNITKPKPASSGSAVIDEKALLGGFRHGEITSVAGGSGTGKTLLTYHAIASLLLSSESNEATLIDTIGSFSPLRLRDVLIYRLEARDRHQRYQESGYVYEKVTHADDEKAALTETATAMLDRVKVMRVFDFAGVIEAIGEVNEVIERTKTASVLSRESDEPSEKREIGDSEEEEESSNGESPTRLAVMNDQATFNPNDGQIAMVIVDTLVNVFGSVISTNHVQGQALLSSFMHTLRHLTARHSSCTIVTNGVVGVKTAGQSSYRLPPEEDVSVFASTMGKPALGRNFTYLIDTSIFLSVVPKTSQDATIAIGQGRDDFEKAIVLEVLSDRCGQREGRWASFEIDSGIKIVPYPR